MFVDGSKKTVAFNNIYLSIKNCEFVSILGPSGCGKTTLLKCLLGIIKPSNGTVTIDGKSTLIFQDYSKSLFPWKNVKNNIKFGLDRCDKEKKQNIYSLLKLVGLEKFEHHYPYELSGGMQQRVALARSLAYNPRVILMDEPFGSLDAQTKLRLEDELLKIWSKFNKTIIFVTHDIEEAIYLSDRIIVMNGTPGKIIADIKINIERPRNQLITKNNKKFLYYWKRIYKLLL